VGKLELQARKKLGSDLELVIKYVAKRQNKQDTKIVPFLIQALSRNPELLLKGTGDEFAQKLAYLVGLAQTPEYLAEQTALSMESYLEGIDYIRRQYINDWVHKHPVLWHYRAVMAYVLQSSTTWTNDITELVYQILVFEKLMAEKNIGKLVLSASTRANLNDYFEKRDTIKAKAEAEANATETETEAETEANATEANAIKAKANTIKAEANVTGTETHVTDTETEVDTDVETEKANAALERELLEQYFAAQEAEDTGKMEIIRSKLLLIP